MGEHDYLMPHDMRFGADDARHCPPNCPAAGGRSRTESDLDAMMGRSTRAERWFRALAIEQFGDDWLPLSVRTMFASDLPQLRNEVRHLREQLAEQGATFSQVGRSILEGDGR